MAKKSRKVRRAAKSKQGSFERLFVEGEELFVEGTAEYGMVMRWLRGHPAIKAIFPLKASYNSTMAVGHCPCQKTPRPNCRGLKCRVR